MTSQSSNWYNLQEYRKFNKYMLHKLSIVYHPNRKTQAHNQRLLRFFTGICCTLIDCGKTKG